MLKFCPYCSSLHKAIANQNYCSNLGDSISDVSTNAYYFKTNNLNSGQHVSRLSIRTISDGYQYHYINKHDFVINKNKYLLINEGEKFESEISANNDVEGLLVAFDKSDVINFYNYLKKTELQLLDDPIEKDEYSLELQTQSIQLNFELRKLLNRLKEDIQNGTTCKVYFEEIFMQILKVIFEDQQAIQKLRNKVLSKKTSTKKEIFRRLQLSRDYIDSNLKEPLGIKELSTIAMMSKYHYLRSFKNVFHTTPHQYITGQRLTKAKYLLRDTRDSIGTICQESGFINTSSFIRLFKSKEGITPNVYRSAI